MPTYTITLSPDHVTAITAKIAAMPQMFDPTSGAPKPTYTSEVDYLVGLIKADVQSMSHYLPGEAARQAARQAAMAALQAAITVTKDL